MALGLPAIVFGGLFDVDSSKVTPLEMGASEVLDAVGRDRVVDAYELVDLAVTRSGLRLNEERWFVVRAELESVSAALDALGWRLAAVATQFDDGWIAMRSTAGPDAVEVGDFDAVTSDRADISRNARRMLGIVPASAGLLVVHVEPAQFAD